MFKKIKLHKKLISAQELESLLVIIKLENKKACID